MKYPKKLTQRANEILSAQRQAAYAKQTKALDWLVKNHLDIAEAKQKIRVLSAKRGMAIIQGGEGIAKAEEEIQAAQEHLDSLMAAAGITEADLKPAFTCPLCDDRGFVDGNICSCIQITLLREKDHQIWTESLLAIVLILRWRKVTSCLPSRIAPRPCGRHTGKRIHLRKSGVKKWKP